MRAGKRERARSREQRRLAHRASCAKGQDRGGVYTSSNPLPPPPQVFLNFLSDIWSGADTRSGQGRTESSSSEIASAITPPFDKGIQIPLPLT